ncbi:hypothetical protein [Bradyrhizobium sp. SSUT18]|uniref:hypothetical protein n=1 Tax=Bradyrhizobium sp. SSUT18 TaxID=3040602 RepID=UPI003262EED4
MMQSTPNALTKLNVARHQLGTALDLFIKDRDPVAVQCLACGGGELIEAIAASERVRVKLSWIGIDMDPGAGIGSGFFTDYAPGS